MAGNADFDPQAFGEMRATLVALGATVTKLETQTALMADSMHQIQLTLASARGGWKMFVGIGSAFFAAGGMAWEFVRHFFK